MLQTTAWRHAKFLARRFHTGTANGPPSVPFVSLEAEHIHSPDAVVGTPIHVANTTRRGCGTSAPALSLCWDREAPKVSLHLHSDVVAAKSLEGEGELQSPSSITYHVLQSMWYGLLCLIKYSQLSIFLCLQTVVDQGCLLLCCVVRCKDFHCRKVSLGLQKCLSSITITLFYNFLNISHHLSHLIS